jgi:hypothetical protein
MTLAIKQGAVKNQARLTILDALADPAILAPWFQGKSWIAWKAFLKALFGLPMGKTTRALYHQHTSRESLPENPSREAWLVVGRRGWKESDALSSLCSFFSGILELDWETSSMEFWIGILGAPRSILGRLLLQRANVLNDVIRLLRCDFLPMRNRRRTHFDGFHLADTTSYDFL